MLAVYRWFTAVLFVAVLVQVGAAGYGIFHAVKKVEDNGSVTKKSLEDGFGFHAALGTIIILAMIVLLIVTAAAASAGRSSSGRACSRSRASSR